MSNANIPSQVTEIYRDQLLAGDRTAARQLVDQALDCGYSPRTLLTGLVWPVMEELQSRYREDRVAVSSLNMATRLNRLICDQLVGSLERPEPNGKKVLILCGDDEPEELGGQICSDLFDSEGYTVRFAGGGVPEDEVLKLIGAFRPDLLVFFATLPSAMPAVRKLIDYLREVNSCPNMQIMCCGGIYKRAEGLAEEIGADLYAPDAAEAIEVAGGNPVRKPASELQAAGRGRRVRKVATRRPPIADTTGGEPTTLAA